jgi:hypothetical protein
MPRVTTQSLQLALEDLAEMMRSDRAEVESRLEDLQEANNHATRLFHFARRTAAESLLRIEMVEQEATRVCFVFINTNIKQIVCIFYYEIMIDS